MVCHASSTFKPECNNDVQHLYILQDIKLYIVGSQSRTLNLINVEVSKGMNNHYWEGRISMVRILKLLRGLKKVHYLICSYKINTLKPNPNAYSWKGGEPLFSFTTALGKKMLRDSKSKINVMEKRWAWVLPYIFKLRWTNNCCKMWSRKETGFKWALWNKAIAINIWRGKVDNSINPTCPLCSNGKESMLHKFWECCHAQRA